MRDGAVDPRADGGCPSADASRVDVGVGSLASGVEFMLALGRAVSVTATGAMERYVTVAISKLYVGYTNGALWWALCSKPARVLTDEA